MTASRSKLERMRRRLHCQLDRVDTLADPGLLEMAQQLDRLIVEEMKKSVPKEILRDEGSGRVKADGVIMLWRR